MQWVECGDVVELVKSYGLDGTTKPLFRTMPYAGEALSLFKLNDKLIWRSGRCRSASNALRRVLPCGYDMRMP